MKIPPQYENHAEEWREEENRRRLGIPEDDERFDDGDDEE